MMKAPASRETRTMRFAAICTVGMLAPVLTLAGCGEQGPQTYPVHGIVKYQNKIVPTGSVMFVPEAGGPQAIGTITKDGTYTLDAIEGQHRVGIVALPEIPEGADPFTYKAPPPYVPSRYERADSSGILVEVKPSSDNTIDLILK